MWSEGSIKVNDSIIHYWVKHYEEPSEEWGIDGGRISKLSLKQDAALVTNYDRGWDIKPATNAAKAVYEILMLEYN